MEQVAASSSQYPVVLDNETAETIGQDLHFAVASDVLSNNSEALLKKLANSVRIGGFVLLEESCGQIDRNLLEALDLAYVAKQILLSKSYFLFMKRERKQDPIVVQITEKNFSWVENAKAALAKSVSKNQNVLFVCQGEELCGE